MFYQDGVDVYQKKPAAPLVPVVSPKPVNTNRPNRTLQRRKRNQNHRALKHERKEPIRVSVDHQQVNGEVQQLEGNTDTEGLQLEGDHEQVLVVISDEVFDQHLESRFDGRSPLESPSSSGNAELVKNL